MADPYSTLGVSRGADEAAIKSAYRKLAKELHPDKNKDNPKAAEKFSEVTRAYDLLSDKDKRARFDRGEIDADGNPASPFGFGGGGGSHTYNRSGSQGPNPADFDFGNGGADFGDIFEGLFGGARRSDRSIRIPLTHGDVVVWGGASRLFFHGIATLKDGRHPLTGGCRINLTFRHSG